MTIFRVEHKKNYTVVNNFICKDNRLSWKAKGIWLYAFSRPDDWEFNIGDLVNQSTDGIDSVRAGLKELSDIGYLQRSRLRNQDGTLGKAEWVFYETPEQIKQCLPEVENPILDNPKQEKATLLSTEEPSTEKNNNREGVVVSSKEGKERLLLLSSSGYEFNETVKKLVEDYSLDDIKLALSVCRHSTDMIEPNAYFTSALKGKWQPKASKEEFRRIEEELKEKQQEQQQKQQQDKMRSEIISISKDSAGKLLPGYDTFFRNHMVYVSTPKNEIEIPYNRDGLTYIKAFIDKYKNKELL